MEKERDFTPVDREDTQKLRSSQGELPTPNNSQHQHQQFVLGQALTSVLNDPRVSFGKEQSSSSLHGENPSLPNINVSNFSNYLQTIQQVYPLFIANQQSLKDPKENFIAPPKGGSTLDVPQVFFREDFELGEQLGLAAESASSAVLLQEKLSHYLDTIEVELIRQISTRSDSFFAALSNLQELHAEVQKTCQQIDHLRWCLGVMDDEVVKKALGVTHLHTKRDHYVDVYRKLKLMANVRQTQQTIQLLLSQSDYGGALDLIYSTQDILTNELAGIQSFKHMGLQLKEMLNLIEKIMQSEFVKLSIEENMNTRIIHHDIESQYHLVPLISGLLRLGKMQVALQSYREGISSTITDVMKKGLQTVITVDNDDVTRPESSLLATHLQQLKSEQYIDLLQSIYNNVMDVLKRVKSIHELVIHVLNMIKERKSSEEKSNHSYDDDFIMCSKRDSQEESKESSAYAMISESYSSQIISESIDMLYSVCELAHAKLSRLLNMRAEANSRLSLNDFSKFFNITQSFIKESESLCGKQCIGLRPTPLAQAKAFLDIIHSNKMSSLALTLENENWSQADIPGEFQALANQLTQSNHTVDETTLAKEIHVDEQKYHVVNSSLMLLKMQKDYLQCLEFLPSLNTDILQRLIELLQLFNSRTCQLVLGAGAMQLVQLKSITAKHLALASQCVGLQIALIPHLKKSIEANLPPKKHVLLNDLDRVAQDYSAHQQEISQKFVSIIRERVQVHCRAMKTIDWKDDSLSVPSQPMQNLVKETGTLHKVLMQLLPAEQVQSIFSNVFDMFNTKIPEGLSGITIPTPAGKKRLVNDITQLVTSLKNIQTGVEPGKALEEFIESNYGEKGK